MRSLLPWQHFTPVPGLMHSYQAAADRQTGRSVGGSDEWEFWEAEVLQFVTPCDYLECNAYLSKESSKAPSPGDEYYLEASGNLGICLAFNLCFILHVLTGLKKKSLFSWNLVTKSLRLFVDSTEMQCNVKVSPGSLFWARWKIKCSLPNAAMRVFPSFFCLFTHYTLYETFRPPLCLSLSLSTGATDKELAFMHEEGIRDPSVCLFEDKEVNREHTSGEIVSRTTGTPNHRRDYWQAVKLQDSDTLKHKCRCQRGAITRKTQGPSVDP